MKGKGRIEMKKKRKKIGELGKRKNVVEGEEKKKVMIGEGIENKKRIEDLKMRRIGSKRKVKIVEVELKVGGREKMVIKIERKLKIVRSIGKEIEIMENGEVRIENEMDKKVEEEKVRNEEKELIEKNMEEEIEDMIKRGDKRLEEIKKEKIGEIIIEIDEMIEELRIDEIGKDGIIEIRSEGKIIVRELDELMNKGILRRIGNMNELEKDREEIGEIKDVENLRKGRILEEEKVVDEDIEVIVGRSEKVILRIKIVIVVRILGKEERVEIGVKMEENEIGEDNNDGEKDVERRMCDILGGERSERREIGLKIRRIEIKIVGEMILKLGKVEVE